MGTRMAPQYANIFMADLEENFLAKYPKKPLGYGRFIDDAFMVWVHGEEELLKFHQEFSNQNPSIKLTMEYSNHKIHFLDTTVTLKNGLLETSVFRKPTDTFSYLHPDSSHPPHTKRSIVYSQALRYNRICSETETRNEQIGELRSAFLKLGYKPQVVDKEINRALQVPRADLLVYRTSEKGDRIPLVLTYHPQLSSIKRIVSDLQPLLDNNEKLSEIFPNRPVITFRQPPNLRNILVRSKISPTLPNGTFPCKKTNCKLCIHMDNSDIYLPDSSGTTFQSNGHFSCASANVVYMIRCRKCINIMYIGETGQTLRKRFNGHRQTIQNKMLHLPVGEHFNSHNHNIADLRVTVIRGSLPDTNQRRIAEQKLIQKFDTVNNGLNRDLGFLAHYRL